MFKSYLKVIGYVVLTVVVLSGVGMGLKVAGVFGERVVFENSFQYKKGMESRALKLKAEIAQIEANIVKFPSKRKELEAQKNVLEIQLQATKL